MIPGETRAVQIAAPASATAGAIPGGTSGGGLLPTPQVNGALYYTIYMQYRLEVT